MLPTTYYLDNFLCLVGFVHETYHELLSPSERLWFDAFQQASTPAQCLYVRLLGRRSDVFRQSKLQYAEIPDIETAAQELCALGLIAREAPESLDVLCEKFTKQELQRLSVTAVAKQVSRPQLLEHLLQQESKTQTRALQQADQWLTVIGQREYAIFSLCFFGNAYQDASEFVLRDLGIVQYENYTIDQSSRAFQCRSQLDKHIQLLDCKNALDQIDPSEPDELLALIDKLPNTNEGDEPLKRRTDRIRNSIARQLERLNQAENALSVYRLSDHHPCRERQVRLLHKMDRFDEAMRLCKAIQAKPYSDEEAQFVRIFMPKLAKSLNLPSKREKTFKPESHKLTLSKTDHRVEFITQDFYKQFGDCFYVENTLFNAVFGLFIWDILFLNLPGVFYNPFQSAPVDFYHSEFSKNRKTQLQERFAELQDPLKFSARVWENFESKANLSNPLVNWAYLSEALLSKALLRIPAQHWHVIFERMLSDLRSHTNGFPDLILFPSDGGYELLEVKGPGDALQKNQRRWMAFFSLHRIPCRVIHVRWAQEGQLSEST